MFDHGVGELSDAAAALDWLQALNPEAKSCWITGFSFGAWIGMQLLMRRPEIEGFISIARDGQPLRLLVPRPLPVLGPDRARRQRTASPRVKEVQALVDKLKTQKGITIEQQIVDGANHFFDGKIDELTERSRLSRPPSRRDRRRQGALADPHRRVPKAQDRGR